MTYDELVERIKKYTNTDDPDDFNPSIPSFIQAAEERISKSLDIEAEIANEVTTAQIQMGQRFVNKPQSSNGIYQLRLSQAMQGPWFHLEMRDRSYCDDYAPGQNVIGAPRYYCVYDSATLMIVPTLDQLYYGEISHQVFITGLSPTKQTTWISLNATELLFEGCLVKAAEFQKKPERAAMHQQMFDSMLSAEQGQAIRQMRDKLRMI